MRTEDRLLGPCDVTLLCLSSQSGLDGCVRVCSLTRKAIVDDGFIEPLVEYCRAELSLDHAVIYARCNRFSDREKHCVPAKPMRDSPS